MNPRREGDEQGQGQPLPIGVAHHHHHSHIHDDHHAFSESPLHRAGLLQNWAPSSAASTPRRHHQDAIRESTMMLSNMVMHHSPTTDPPHPPSSSPPPQPSLSSSSSQGDHYVSDEQMEARPRPASGAARQRSPSGLSILIERERGAGRMPLPHPSLAESPTKPTVEERWSAGEALPTASEYSCSTAIAPTTLFPTPSFTLSPPPLSPQFPHDRVCETTPLLLLPPSEDENIKSEEGSSLARAVFRVEHVLVAFRSIPAVILGCLLNVLDGVSYGMILFPASGIFVDLPTSSMGVSMFFVTTLIAQLVYTFGGSAFAGGNGSMMIEVVPFFHMIANKIAQEIGEGHPDEIMATTVVAFALSSILTGLSFFILGALRLGAVMGFFPRHILIGCIGGIGAFLIETGLTVSTRIDDDEFDWSLESLRMMFLDKHNVTHWIVPFALAIILRLITHKYHHQLIFPLYILVVFVAFYLVVVIARLDLGSLRAQGWVFDMGKTSQDWYTFYTYLNFKAVKFGPLLSTMPSQLALLFFNILHPPLNVPALSISLNLDVDTNKELVAHGYSNLLAGITGVVPNYLVYVNTLLFYRVGGDTRIAGFLLALSTVVLLWVGTGFISFIPIMVVGALIFVLGIDLVKEALWDTRHRVSRMEYITIASIVVAMTAWDFVIGVLLGIIATCFFFVVQNSQRSSIRAFHTGETAMSTVRRPVPQRDYLREVSKQTSIVRLQGFLFFGTIARVEEQIRGLIEGPGWTRNPVRFLVLDMTHVAGMDMSAAEAFVRLLRLLAAKKVVLVFCGTAPESKIVQALQSVEVLGSEGVELFSTFHDTMEWTENAYLRAWFKTQKMETSALSLPGRQDLHVPFLQSVASSPRRSHLRDVGNRTLTVPEPPSSPSTMYATEPFNTFLKTFSPHGDLDYGFFRPLLVLLERISAPEGLVLWQQGDEPDGMYMIQEGVLRASYRFADYAPPAEESMVPDTLAGELTALSGLPRNATVVVERQAVLWKFSIDTLRKLEVEQPAVVAAFTRLVLKSAKLDFDILLAAMATRQ